MSASAALFQVQLRRGRTLLGSLALGLFSFELLIAGVYGLPAEGILSQLLAGVRLPRFLRALTGGSMDVFSLEGWLGFGYTHPLPLIMLIAWTVASASGAVAQEVEDGTMEVLASRPVDRRRVLAARVAAWGAGAILLLASGYLGTLVGSVLVDELSGLDRVAALRLPASLAPLLVSMAGVAYLASAASSTRGRANGVAIGFAVVSYFLNLTALVWAPAEALGPLSVFHYLAPGDWLNGGVNGTQATVPVVVGVGLLGLALVVFHRRDIAP